MTIGIASDRWVTFCTILTDITRVRGGGGTPWPPPRTIRQIWRDWFPKTGAYPNISGRMRGHCEVFPRGFGLALALEFHPPLRAEAKIGRKTQFGAQIVFFGPILASVRGGG